MIGGGRSIDRAIEQELDRLDEFGRRRQIVAADQTKVDFVSNDYLGLSTDAGIARAAADAAITYGASGRASRLLGGGSPLHRDAERVAAEWLGGEDALLFPSGFQANLGLVPTLVERDDVILSDELNHASIVDACRLARGTTRVHRHLDIDEIARELRQQRHARRRFVVTEGVFSMDGDRPPIADLLNLCERHDAWLLLDEAHSIGVLGRCGAGAAAEAGVAEHPRLLARMITGGKALGASGAMVVTSRAVRQMMVQRSRALLFTTAPPATMAGSFLAAISRVRDADDLRVALRQNVERVAVALGIPAPPAAILPIHQGDEHAVLAAARQCHDAGLDIRAVRPPSVPAGKCRLRVVIHANHFPDELDRLVVTLRQLPTTPAPSGFEPAPDPHRTESLRNPVVVVGTDTGVGKTVISALLMRGATRFGSPRYWKPVQTGSDDDTTAVATLADASLTLAPSQRFPLPASPHEAAAAVEQIVDVDAIDVHLASHRDDADPLIVELAGGLFVPYSLEQTQIDWLRRHQLGVVLVARSGLGTLNHTLLSIEALRRRDIPIRALFLVGPPHRSNLATLRAMGRVAQTFEVPLFEKLEPPSLDAWLDAHDLSRVWEE